jgi:hypothetical protein
MSVHIFSTARRTATLSRLRAILPTSQFDRAAQPPLRAELFLLAHDDETGRLHLSKRQLETGLAATVLTELWMDEHIAIGWRYDARTGPWHADPGRITVLTETATGDPLLDSALDLLSRLSAPRIHDFIQAFTRSGGLYEKVRGDMTASGVLRTSIRRRLFSRREVYTATDPELPVRIRARIRRLVTETTVVPIDRNRPAQYLPALAGLVTALGLTRNLSSSDITARTLHTELNRLVNGLPDPTIRDVMAAMFPGGRHLTASGRR